MKRIFRPFLTLALAISLYLPVVNPVVIPVAIGAGAVTLSACGGDSKEPVREFKTNLKKTAETLNAVAKANRSLYTSLGAQYLETRIKVATGVHQANEYLIAALEFSKNLSKENFPQNKAQALKFLQDALAAIVAVKIGRPEVDLVIQTVVGLINTGISIVTALTGKSKVIKVIRSLDVAEVQGYFNQYTFEYTQEAVWTS